MRSPEATSILPIDKEGGIPGTDLSPRMFSLRNRWREKRPERVAYDDEYRNENTPTLQILPYQPPAQDKWGNPVDQQLVLTQMQGDFDYYSRTRRLEFNTEKTDFLEDLAKKMLLGTDWENKPVRVVIMSKSQEPDAFVYPDGTVFLSQSLLNTLGSLDEIGGVLAHELSHLVNRTFDRSLVSSGSVIEFGIGALHEMVADAQAKDLAVKANLNTFGIDIAIDKISHNERGDIHGSGLARASQGVAVHAVRDYATSSQSFQPKPDLLNGEAYPTNLELIQEAFKKEDKNAVLELMDKLHPRDLSQAYQMMFSEFGNRWHKGSFKKRDQIIEGVNSLLVNRLIEKGFSDKQANVFIYALQSEQVYAYVSDKLVNPQFSEEIFSNLQAVESADGFFRMSKALFGKGIEKSAFYIIIGDFSFMPYGGDFKMPIEFNIYYNQEDFLEVLDKLNQIKVSPKYQHEKEIALNRALLHYASNTFVANARNDLVDKDQIKTFFQLAREIGIPLELSFLSLERFSEHYVWDGGVQIKFTDQNIALLKEAYTEVCEQSEGTGYRQEIDKALEKMQQLQFGKEATELVKDLFALLRNYVEIKKLDDNGRLEILSYLDSKIEELEINPRGNLLAELKRPDNNTYPETDYEESLNPINNQIARFSFKLNAALAIFPQDNEAFYQHIEGLFGSLPIDINSFDRAQLAGLTQGLWEAEQGRSGLKNYYRDRSFYIYPQNLVSIKNIDRFTKIPIIKRIMESETEREFTNMRDLLSYMRSEFFVSHLNKGENYSIYGESFTSLYFGRFAREGLNKLLAQGIPVEDYSHLFRFINTYYPNDENRTEMQRWVNSYYLTDETISLQDKTDHLVSNFESIGPEGLLTIAKQIKTIEEYKQFREKVAEKFEDYLNGSMSITKLAAADYLSSFLVRSFETLLETTKNDPASILNATSVLGRAWLAQYFPSRRYDDPKTKPNVVYDDLLGKFRVRNLDRATFKSLTDHIEMLKGLSSVERFAIAQKALTEVNGILANQTNKAILARFLINALAIKEPFIQVAIEAIAQTKQGDERFVGFTGASMLAPLLFRSLDASVLTPPVVDAIIHKSRHSFRFLHSMEDPDKMPDPTKLSEILQTHTRELKVFSADYAFSDLPWLREIVRNSDESYHAVTASLRRQFEQSTATASQPESPVRIDNATEGLFRGVESSGPVFVKGLQMSTQLFKFPSHLERRAAQSFDANPGMNKLVFWEELYRLSQEKPEVAQLISNMEIYDYAGGGSIRTAFAAAITTPEGERRKVIIKMTNPNSRAFIQNSARIAKNSLRAIKSGTITVVERGEREGRFAYTRRLVAERGKSIQRRLVSPQIARQAANAELLIDISQEWAMAELDDPTFEEDDDVFRYSAGQYNSRSDGSIIIPSRIFYSDRLYVEDMIEGQTLNKFIQDPQVSDELKKEAVTKVTQFYLYQLRNPILANDGGQKFALVHSDPHVGNFIVDTSGGAIKVGVIDRHMYFKLNEGELRVVDSLIRGDQGLFLNNLLDHVLAGSNKGSFEIARIKTSIATAILTERGVQHVRGIEDNLAVLRIALAKLSQSGLTPSRPLRLMMRNIISLKSLLETYDLSITTF